MCYVKNEAAAAAVFHRDAALHKCSSSQQSPNVQTEQETVATANSE